MAIVLAVDGNMNTCSIKIVSDDRFFVEVGGGSEKNVSIER